MTLQPIESEGGSVAEYVIHAKLKNNLILSRILAQHRTVAEFCKQFGLSNSIVGDLINMKKLPARRPWISSIR
jgi:hypothetical protein